MRASRARSLCQEGVLSLRKSTELPTVMLQVRACETVTAYPTGVRDKGLRNDGRRYIQGNRFPSRTKTTGAGSIIAHRHLNGFDPVSREKQRRLHVNLY